MPPPLPPHAQRDDQDFARLVRALPLGVVFVDRSRASEFANPAAGTIFDFDAERAIGAHVIASIPNVEFERRIDEALRGEASVAPMTFASRDGARTYGVSVYPLSRPITTERRRGVCRRSDGPRASGSRAQRVS